MRRGCYVLVVVVAVLAIAVNAEEKLRLCVQEGITNDRCSTVERGDSPVRCERVVDSAECAIKIAEGRADFGRFNADELLLTHHFYPTGIQVVAELKHQDRTFEQFEFQSVAIVPKSYVPSEAGFGSLFGAGFCHPGFSQSQVWNDHVLKYFEQKVMNNVCRSDRTVAENDIINLRDFFKKGCRPGPWVPQSPGGSDNNELKNKYPEMCELCDDRVNCAYINKESHGHAGALDCLTSGRGQVAYVSLQVVKDYFAPNSSTKKMEDYKFLCANGSVMALDSPNPCTWFKQPWDVVLSRESKADKVRKALDQSSKVTFSLPWEQTLKNIVQDTDRTMFLYNNYTTPAHYLSRAHGTDVDLPRLECGKQIQWCTVSELEQTKCKWIAAAARVLGIKPTIECVAARSTFECFNLISRGEADIITIDSNYGHLARRVYGLGPIAYCETSAERSSFVVATIRDKARSKRITSFAEVKDSNACFPEYGGIAWLSFINVARQNRVIPDSCKYSQIMANLLHGACTPGFVEANHAQDLKRRSLNDNLSKLCELCPKQQNGERCEATSENLYYGDKGALDCLKEGAGDIAFLEARNIRGYINNGSINATDFRVLCKNGTLAEYTGFDVDRRCALSVTIDSEVVSRRDRPKHEQKDASFMILKIESWLGYRGDSARRSVHVYDPFNGTANLLFKDSTTGMVTLDSEIDTVSAYKELFDHVDACSSSLSVVAILALVLVNFVAARLI